jgi:hypothetical protein
MRNFIFIAILVSMAGLGIWHVTTESWTSLSIDLFVAFFAFRTWNPFGQRRR